MLHFAYGANMDPRVMHRHAPGAVPLGIAALAHHRFVITADGYASVAPARRQTVYGVLWRLTPRDRIKLDLWENVAGRKYRTDLMPVQQAGRRHAALVYVGTARRPGRPRAGYMELVVTAARQRQLPPAYMTTLQAWLRARPSGAGPRSLKELGWP